MSTLGSFLQSLGARAVANSEYEFDLCPWCSGKKVMRFNISKMIGVCYKCPRTVFLRDLAVDVAGIPAHQVKKYVEDFNADERLKMGFAEAMLDGLLGTDRARTISTLQPVALPDEFRLLQDGQSSVVGRKALAYMVGRGCPTCVLYDMKFGYCASGLYEGRVIIPFYENGELVYWQARDFTGNVSVENKIKNPRTLTTSHGKSDVLFNFDGVKRLETIIMTESWGSSLAVGRRAFAINGKSLSEVQGQKVLDMKADTVIILLDAETAEQSWRTAKRLAPYKRVLVCTLPYGDPADVSHPVLLDTVRQALPYTIENHIRSVALGSWGRG